MTEEQRKMRPDLSQRARIKDALELIEQAKDMIKLYEKFMAEGRLTTVVWQHRIASEAGVIDVLRTRIRKIQLEPTVFPR